MAMTKTTTKMMIDSARSVGSIRTELSRPGDFEKNWLGPLTGGKGPETK